MELYLLQSFVAVARAGSLSGAAIARNISLSGLSKHIKMLEEFFGSPLYKRRPRGMELTEKGREVLRYAEEILERIENLTSLAKPSSTLRLGVNIGPQFLQLAELTQLLQKKFPEKKLHFTDSTSHSLLQQMDAGALDLCLAFGDIPRHLRKQLICKVHLPLMLPAIFGAGDIDLQRSPWIAGTGNCPFQKKVEAFWQQQGIVPQTTIVAKDSSQKELVGQGLGIGFLEPQDAVALIDGGFARCHPQHFLEIPLSVVYSEKIQEPIVGVLRTYVAACYAPLDSLAGGLSCPSGTPGSLATI